MRSATETLNSPLSYLDGPNKLKPPMKPSWFIKQVTLGNIIQIAALLVVGAAAWDRVTSRVTRNEEDVKAMRVLVEKMQETQSVIVRTQDRLTYIIEQQEKRKP